MIGQWAIPLTICLAGMITTSLSGQVDVQGHRGWRGLYPENSIPGFLAALELGVDVLEMDVVISGDGHPVVSHEPWMNPEICVGPQGQRIRKGRAQNLFRMSLEEIQTFDCGALIHPRFPDQMLGKVAKPSLAEVLATTEAWGREHPGISFGYNIEIKRQARWEGKYCPPVPEFCDAVLKVIRQAGLRERVVLQSFDTEVLEYLHRNAPEYPLAFLVERGRLAVNLKKLSFQPVIYSPSYRLLDAEEMRWARGMGLLVIPWTVNESPDIRKILDLGVDAVISDYPERVLKMLNRL